MTKLKVLFADAKETACITTSLKKTAIDLHC